MSSGHETPFGRAQSAFGRFIQSALAEIQAIPQSERFVRSFEIGKAILDELREQNELSVDPQSPITSWGEFSSTLLRRQREGLDSNAIPDKFEIAQGLHAVFDEMLPTWMGLPDVRHFDDPAVQQALRMREVARGIIPNNQRTKLLVQNRNAGNARVGFLHLEVERRARAGEIGDIHTHPIGGMPSSIDLTTLLIGLHVARFVVTPGRTIALFRTTRTPQLFNIHLAQGYLAQMGKDESWAPAFNETAQRLIRPFFPEVEQEDPDVWPATYASLNKLSIAAFEAPRGSREFVRKTSFVE